jgi:hypothetical protein
VERPRARGRRARVHFDPEPPPCGTSTDWNATANTTNDITKLVVNHTAERVVLTLRFRDLA